MIVRRAALLVLCALGIPACGGKSKGPTPAPAVFRVLDASGGSSDADDLLGDGGSGGAISVVSTGAIRLATGDTPPTAPAGPVAPTTGTELTNALIDAGAPLGGNLLVSATLQITGTANPPVITTVSGDIVVSGTLIGSRSAGVRTNGITLNAPAGTIYVLGEIRTRGTPGTPDNPFGGGVTLNAQRVVIRGLIDTRGEFGEQTVGGEGGFLTIDATDDLLILGGSIWTGGGGARVTGGAGGFVYGGTGGDVTLTAADELSVFGAVVTDGGAVTASTQFPQGGKAGAITMRGDGKTDVVADLSLRGGVATGGKAGGLGGDGGVFTTGSPAPYRVYGSIVTAGGGVYAESAPPGILIRGGVAGDLRIGATGNPVAWLELGRGAVVTSGGSGRLQGSNAGAIDVASLDGDIDAAGPVVAAGGTGKDAGGSGGDVKIVTDQDAAGNTANHHLSFQGTIDTRVGDHAGPIGSHAGAVTLQCGGDLTWSGSIQASGMGKFSFGGEVLMLVQAVNRAPTGMLAAAGTIDTQGGISPDGFFNGTGKSVVLAGAQGLTFSGAITTRGYDAGGVSIASSLGDCDVSGTLVATTDGTTIAARAGSIINLIGFSGVRFSGMADASASNVDPASPGLPGGSGGVVQFLSQTGAVTLQEGSLLRADGGNPTTGVGVLPGGEGGRIQMLTRAGAVTLQGSLFARGGSNGAGGAGGVGGLVQVDSDLDTDGVGGAITLAADGLIDVSGGAGIAGGSALNNGGAAPADASGANLAVILDAAGSLGASVDGAGVGVVRNLGRIVARGNSPLARGGDLWFDGSTVGGGELSGADLGTVDLSGLAGAGAFYPN